MFRDSDLHHKGVNNDAGWLMGEILGKCLGLVTGAEWRRVRSSIGDSFNHKSASSSVTRVTALTSAHFEDLLANGNLREGILDPARDLRLLPFRVVADYVYGPLTPGLRRQLEDLIPLREPLFTRVIQGGVTRFSWSRFLPSKTNRDLHQFKLKWASFNDTVYRECHMRTKDTIFVQMYESMKNGLVEQQHVLHTLDEMLFGNLDVTIGAISWNPVFLAANEDVQAQIRDEIRHSRTSTSTSEQPTWEKYIQRPDTLLAASILESARLRPLAAFSIPQAAPTERVVAGFKVPAGTNFIIDSYMLNIKNPYWGEDSTVYRPSRFLGRDQSKMRYQYWRFGFGPRQCLGKYVGEIILRVLVAHLVENYQLTLSATSTWDRNPDVWITHPDTTIQCKKLELL